MLELSDLASWRDYAQRQRAMGRSVALVPTMGALHAGHVSLFQRAREGNDVVLATIFVNPRQFHDATDLERYPRTPEHDRGVALECGVDALISPPLHEMWPDFPGLTPTTVTLGALGEVFEGVGRPGHFDGVASVVAKLLVVTGACRAYFGEKDFQQLAVIRQMVRDLAFDVEVVGCAIVRDGDGLALSSRNVQLSVEGRGRALSLSRALLHVASTPRPASAQRAAMMTVLREGDVDVAYADVVDRSTLTRAGDDERGEHRALVAGYVDGVRLLDNGPVDLVRG